ncbi:MAG: bifunctional phosphoribosylaminoimidazolecarboxamide formyltransferase/IMP cyclohydrolase, partial [Planctomycetota bacterium]
MSDLRYGENPHQLARLVADYCDVASVAHAEQHHGKQLGYINLLDADAALNVVREWETAACCIVKHATPCGVGIGDGVVDAFGHAHVSDPLAAFGGVVALNKPIDLATATAMADGQKFLEVIVAPSFDDDALAVLTERWKNVRLLSVGDNVRWPEGGTMSHDIVGGKLVQDRDTVGVIEAEWQVVTKR